ATTTAIETLTSTSTSIETSPADMPSFFTDLVTPGIITTLSVVFLMLAILAVAISSLSAIETPAGLKSTNPDIKKKAQ
ncbi:hypothetical protein IWQ60_009896, partial [Tieghemiomyces parasiticus]